jgi:methylmalonyl-CoA mutase C-terminal domain/subunit
MNSTIPPRRILIAKAGLDGHDRGARVIATALRDAGFEVIYTGLHQTPEMVVRSAIQEDVDGIGLSVLSGAHMTLFPAILKLLKRNKADEIFLFGGGIIPESDLKKLIKKGVKQLFLPGASTKEIIDWLKNSAPRRQKSDLG